MNPPNHQRRNRPAMRTASNTEGAAGRADAVLRAQVTEHVSWLTNATGWDAPTLLDQFGADAGDPQRLGSATGPRLRQLERVLSLSREVARRVEKTADRRTIVVECAAASAALDDDTEGLAETLRAKPSADLSPLEYVELGELTSAFRAVKRHTRGCRGPRNPYDAAPLVHLSTPRIEAFLRGEQNTLGVDVYQRIVSHLNECEACSSAVEAQRETVVR